MKDKRRRSLNSSLLPYLLTSQTHTPTSVSKFSRFMSGTSTCMTSSAPLKNLLKYLGRTSLCISIFSSSLLLKQTSKIWYHLLRQIWRVPSKDLT